MEVDRSFSPKNTLATASNLRPFLDLLELVANPTAAAKRIEELQAATDQAQKSVEHARAKIDAEQQQHQEKLAAAQADHDRRLSQERIEFNEACEERQRDLAAREAKLKTATDSLVEERAKLTADAADARTKLNAETAAMQSQHARLRR
jgi:chromosome segregation ATPase